MLCNGSGSYCLGTLSMNASADQGLASSLETRRHYLAWEQGSAYIWNIWKAKGVKGNNSRKFHLTTYVAVGSQDSVAASLTAIWNHR